MDNRITGIYRTYMDTIKGVGKKPKAVSPNMRERGDRVEFSPVVDDIRMVKKYLEKVPDVRRELVDRLRTQIATGSYHPPIDKIVEKMLGD